MARPRRNRKLSLILLRIAAAATVAVSVGAQTAPVEPQISTVHAQPAVASGQTPPGGAQDTAGSAPPAHGEPSPANTVSQPRLLIHLPGIGGERSIDHNLVRGLADGGLAGRQVIYDWTGSDTGLMALVGQTRNRQEAKGIADAITRAYRAAPQLPIVITAHSGGTGIAIWALELLPEGIQVEQVVLLASALSPQYDLTRAIARVRGSVFSFHSPLDGIVLGTGTRTFGTIDGVNTDSAGMTGFVVPEHNDAYTRLQQFAYDKAWMRFDNNGGHIGVMSRAFAREVIAPLILKDTPPPTSDPMTTPKSTVNESPFDVSGAGASTTTHPRQGDRRGSFPTTRPDGDAARVPAIATPPAIPGP